MNIFYCFVSHESKISEHSHTIKNIMNSLNYSNYGIFYSGSSDNYFHKGIHLKCNDSYEGLPNKIHNIFKYVTSNKDLDHFSHFCKVDSTCPIISLVDIIDKDYYGVVKIPNNAEANRSWHFDKTSTNSKWKNKKYEGIFIPYCMGGCYVLSRKAANIIANNPDDFNEDIYEDLYVSQKLNLSGIVPYNHNMLKYMPNNNWTDYSC